MTETYDAERADSDDAGPTPDPVVTPPGDDDRSGLSSGARAFFDWVVVVGVALLVAILVRTFLLAHFVVDGQSMYSTLSPGDRVFVNKMSYKLHDPGRGDVVVLHEISGAIERDLIKRVIALPGEEIRMADCVVWIDTDPTDDVPAQRLDEPYLDPTVVTPGNCGSSIEPLVIPDDTVFVMGDNRPGSHDSRALGPVSYDDLVGRAFVVFWPRADWQWL
ncbi:MAG: signal peptidase I [Ilumatobacteraceae bacterium]